jgi:hypothetical protein
MEALQCFSGMSSQDRVLRTKSVVSFVTGARQPGEELGPTPLLPEQARHHCSANLEMMGEEDKEQEPRSVPVQHDTTPKPETRPPARLRQRGRLLVSWGSRLSDGVGMDDGRGRSLLYVFADSQREFAPRGTLPRTQIRYTSVLFGKHSPYRRRGRRESYRHSR